MAGGVERGDDWWLKKSVKKGLGHKLVGEREIKTRSLAAKEKSIRAYNVPVLHNRNTNQVGLCAN